MTDQNIKMDIDLVPCFVFGIKQWPPGFRKMCDIKVNFNDEQK